MSDALALKKGQPIHWERGYSCAVGEVLDPPNPKADNRWDATEPLILVPGEARLRTAKWHLPEDCSSDHVVDPRRGESH
jgi:hypothetical protein